MKKSIVLATAVASVLTSSVALADFTGNAAVASNYVWRGVSQTENQASGQGGLDWGNDSGLYAGTWVSNVDFAAAGGEKGYEMDLYVGFAGEAGGLGYDVGVISYQYPMEPQINFTEVYVSGSMSMVTVGLAYTVDAASANDAEKTPNATGMFESGDIYVSASLDFPLGKSDLSLYAGSYMFNQDGKDYSATGGTNVGDINYNHFGASIGKDGFAFAVDKNDIDGGNADNVRFTVSYGVDFEL